MADIDGHGTLADWMHAVWDQHTAPSGCSMSRLDMAFVYGVTINLSGLTNGGFFAATKTAMSLYSSGCESNWDAYACHNGIDREGQPWSGC